MVWDMVSSRVQNNQQLAKDALLKGMTKFVGECRNCGHTLFRVRENATYCCIACVNKATREYRASLRSGVIRETNRRKAQLARKNGVRYIQLVCPKHGLTKYRVNVRDSRCMKCNAEYHVSYRKRKANDHRSCNN